MKILRMNHSRNDAALELILSPESNSRDLKPMKLKIKWKQRLPSGVSILKGKLCKYGLITVKSNLRVSQLCGHFNDLPFEIRFELVHPPQATRFSCPGQQPLGSNGTPVSSPKLSNIFHQNLIFFWHPWPFSQHLVPGLHRLKAHFVWPWTSLYPKV